MYVYVYKLLKGNFICGATNGKNIKKEKEATLCLLLNEMSLACLLCSKQAD